MQVSQAEQTKTRVGEESRIRFRPSPNFKNMKKFLKSRKEYSETTLASPNAFLAPVVQPACEIAEIKEKKPVVLPHVVVPPKAVVVQPPLPPYPPPASPPYNVTIKQEVMDEEEQNRINEEREVAQENIPPSVSGHTPENQAKPGQKKTMCKEFIRGNCIRSVCKFAHEVDVSQLVGVYTFCWNFQNDVCKFPNCRFVHASVFEEQEFYRTGVLPPHARQHLKKQQPAPLEKIQPMQHEMNPANFGNPPPPVALHHTCIDQNNDFRTARRIVSPLKRERSEMEDFSTSPRDYQPSAKCKKCDELDERVRRKKEEIDLLSQTSEDMKRKIGSVSKKVIKIKSVIMSLITHHNTAQKVTINNGYIHGSDKELLLEQLKAYFGSSSGVGSNHRLSGFLDDGGMKSLPSTSNSTYGVSPNNLLGLAKLFGPCDQGLSLDTSREA